MTIDLEHATYARYRCDTCRRRFTAALCAAHNGKAVRCPACGGDDVQQWLSRYDRIMRFLMLYEAA